jgi:hypothetical protein
MRIIDSYEAEPLDATSTSLHINPLEFLGCIVNMWILLKQVQTLPLCPTGYIVDLLSDNTSSCALVDEVDGYYS